LAVHHEAFAIELVEMVERRPVRHQVRVRDQYADYPLETLEPGLEEQAYYDPNNFSFPGGAGRPAASAISSVIGAQMSPLAFRAQPG
jgi:hypothetical protein